MRKTQEFSIFRREKLIGEDQLKGGKPNALQGN
jgi:hypothetical protein